MGQLLRVLRAEAFDGTWTVTLGLCSKVLQAARGIQAARRRLSDSAQTSAISKFSVGNEDESLQAPPPCVAACAARLSVASTPLLASYSYITATAGAGAAGGGGGEGGGGRGGCWRCAAARRFLVCRRRKGPPHPSHHHHHHSTPIPTQHTN